MNDLHTTINGVKEEGGLRDYREWAGDKRAEKWEWQWNGYPLPKGVRITGWPPRKAPNPDGVNQFGR